MVSRRNLAAGLETFSHCPASSLAMSVSPLLADPYESRWVEVRQSTVRGGGDGLFARRDIPPDTVVSFYHGLVYRSQWRPSLTRPDRLVGGSSESIYYGRDHFTTDTCACNRSFPGMEATLMP